MEGQIKCFPDKVKLKEFIITKLLYEMFKGLNLTKKDDQKYKQRNKDKLTTLTTERIQKKNKINN